MAKIYKVICLDTAFELENAVNELLAKGGELVGGLYVDAGHGNYPYKHFYQALFIEESNL